MKKNKKILTSQEKMKRIKETEEREMFLMFRYLFATVAMIIGIMVVLSIRKQGVTTLAFYEHAKLPLEIVFGSLSILFAMVHVIMKAKNIDESKRMISSFDLLAVSLLGFLLFFSYGHIGVEHDSGRIVSIIVLTVLFFIYHTHNTVLFTVSAQSAFAVLSVALLGIFSGSVVIKTVIFSVAVLMSCVGVWFLYIFVSKQNKDSELKKTKLTVNTVLILIGLVVSFVLPGIANYVVYGILALYLAIAVIPAIEMI